MRRCINDDVEIWGFVLVFFIDELIALPYNLKFRDGTYYEELLDYIEICGGVNKI